MNDGSDPRELTVQRLVQWVYGRRIIGNVERGAYVECMIELALRKHDPAWHMTEPWTGWDLEHRQTRARIEIKQSAALQRWHARVSESQDAGTGSAPKPRARPRFSIKPHEGYYSEDGTWTAIGGAQRLSDLYVFAWHPKDEPETADQRHPDQWEFFVVPELSLPQDQPLAESIGLTRLAGTDDAERGNYNELATMVAKALKSIRTLKADRTLTDSGIVSG